MMVSWSLLPFLKSAWQQPVSSSIATANHPFVLLPNELLLEIISYLDVISIYRMTRVSASYRYLLLSHHTHWTHIYFDPSVPVNEPSEIRRLLGLLVTRSIYNHIHSLRLDGCSIQAATLELLLRHLPGLQHLSIKACPRLDCFQFLAILERAFFTDRRPYSSGQQRRNRPQPLQQATPVMLQHLRRLDMRGLFPSELEGEVSGGVKACAREMYCYRAINQILTFPLAIPLFFLSRQLPFPGEDGSVQNAHAVALYHQFWLLFNHHQRQQQRTLVRGTSSSLVKVMMDVGPCTICRRYIAPNGTTIDCANCGNPTFRPCQQCVCHPCGRVLCRKCFFRRQRWRVIHCTSCRLARQVCEDCCLDDYPSIRWTCRLCFRRRIDCCHKLTGAQGSRRNPKRLLWSWMPWPSFLFPPQHLQQQQQQQQQPF